MAVDVISERNAIARPGLPENFIIAQPALIKAHIKPRDFMSGVVYSAVNRFIFSVHKPVMARAVHLDQLALTGTLVARLVLLLLFRGPGARRLKACVLKDMPARVVRKRNAVVFSKVLAEGRERRILPVFIIDPDNFGTERIGVFFLLVNKTFVTVDERPVTDRNETVLQDKDGLRRDAENSSALTNRQLPGYDKRDKVSLALLHRLIVIIQEALQPLPEE